MAASEWGWKTEQNRPGHDGSLKRGMEHVLTENWVTEVGRKLILGCGRS